MGWPRPCPRQAPPEQVLGLSFVRLEAAPRPTSPRGIEDRQDRVGGRTGLQLAGADLISDGVKVRRRPEPRLEVVANHRPCEVPALPRAFAGQPVETQRLPV